MSVGSKFLGGSLTPDHITFAQEEALETGTETTTEALAGIEKRRVRREPTPLMTGVQKRRLCHPLLPHPAEVLGTGSVAGALGTENEAAALQTRSAAEASEIVTPSDDLASLKETLPGPTMQTGASFPCASCMPVPLSKPLWLSSGPTSRRDWTAALTLRKSSSKHQATAGGAAKALSPLPGALTTGTGSPVSGARTRTWAHPEQTPRTVGVGELHQLVSLSFAAY